jgi:hypothetical protein
VENDLRYCHNSIEYGAKVQEKSARLYLKSGKSMPLVPAYSKKIAPADNIFSNDPIGMKSVKGQQFIINQIQT